MLCWVALLGLLYAEAPNGKHKVTFDDTKYSKRVEKNVDRSSWDQSTGELPVAGDLVPATPALVGKLSPAPAVEFALKASLWGFYGIFRISGKYYVHLLVDTAARRSYLDARVATFWEGHIKQLPGEYILPVGGVFSVIPTDVGLGVFPEWGIQEKFLLGSELDRVEPVDGVLSLSPHSPLGRKPFLMMPTGGGEMIVTWDVGDASTHCVKAKRVALPLDRMALKHNRLFMVPEGEIHVGLVRHPAPVVIASGMQGIGLPSKLYDAFADLAHVPRDETLYCHRRKQYPPIRIVLFGEAGEQIEISVSFEDYCNQSLYGGPRPINGLNIVPVRPLHDSRIILGPAFLSKMVTLFDAHQKRVHMCHSA